MQRDPAVKLQHILNCEAHSARDIFLRAADGVGLREREILAPVQPLVQPLSKYVPVLLCDQMFSATVAKYVHIII